MIHTLHKTKLIAFVITATVLASLLAATTTNFFQKTTPIAEAVAAADMFIKFDGVDGEARDKNHKGWSDLASYSQGYDTEEGDSSRRRGDVIVEDFLVKKDLDKSSPQIAEALLTGKVFPKVEIHVTANYGGSRATYLKYELTNVQVTSYNSSGHTGQVPVDSFSLNFEEIKVTYTERNRKGKSKGNIEYSWKVEEGES